MIPLRPGASGPDVVRLQRALIALGYPLPRWGADGHLGDETLAALGALLADHGRARAEAPGEVTRADLDLVAELALARDQAAPLPWQSWHDLRSSASRRWVMRRRAWTEVTGITLHQTACVLGERPDRWLGIGAHLGVTRGGRAMWLHDLEVAVVHGNGLNADTVGIELDGTYAGVEGDPATFWRAPGSTAQPQAPTVELVETALAVCRWIAATVARHGGRVRHVWAHRQASAQRRSDPGGALWQAVAVPLAAELGLEDVGDQTRGDGAPIPEAWDPRRRGVRY